MKNRQLSCILHFLLALLSLPGLSIAQSERFAARHLTVEDGLPSSFVYRAIQDRKGYMWLLTDRGVCRYSNNRFRTYSRADGLPSNDIWNGVPDSAGIFWVNTFGPTPVGIWSDSIIRPVIDPNLSGVQKTDDIFIRDGSIYFSTNSGRIAGAGHIDGDSAMPIQPTKDANLHVYPVRGRSGVIVRHWKSENSAKEAHIEILSLGQAGYQAGNRIPLQEFTRGIHRLDPNDPLQMDAFWKGLAFINSEQFLVWWPPRLYRGRIGHEFEALETPGIDHPESDYLIDAVGAYWFFHGNEHSFLTDSLFNPLPEFDFLNELNVNSLTCDDSGNFWVCTKDDGIYFFPQDFAACKMIKHAGEGKSQKVIDLARGPEGKIVALFGDNTLLAFEDGKPLPFSDSKSVRKNPFDDPVSLSWKEDLGLLVGYGQSGIRILDEERFDIALRSGKASFLDFETMLRGPLAESRNTPKVIKEIKTRDQQILVACRRGIWRYDIATTAGQWLGEGLKSYTVEVMTDSAIWIGTDKGLAFEYPRGHSNADWRKNRQWDVPVKKLIADEKGRLFIGTDGLGVFEMKGEELFAVEGTNGLIVTALEFSKDGSMLLIGSNQGVLIRHFNENGSPSDLFLNASNGLSSNEITCLLESDGKLYVGTNFGLAIADLSALQKSRPSQPRIYIESVRIMGQIQPLQSIYRLPHDQNNIEVRLAGIAFESGNEASFQYRIIGKDTSWQALQGPFLLLSSLASGEYKLQFKMQNLSRIESEVRTLSLVISLPFWRKTWFILLLGFLLVSVVLSGAEFRNRKQQKAAERERTIQEKFYALELQALRSQMNPHFIFNALNSLQSVIIREDFLVANEFLGRFSRLLRLSLEASRNQMIYLQDELDLLDNYIRLEQFRFQEKFQFDLRLSPGLQANEVEIPSMLIQPLVENAILHGLTGGSEPPELILRVDRTGDELRIEITDNGIGIDAAKARKRTGKQPSRGLQIMQERMDLLAQLHGLDISLDFIDRSRIGEGTGTKVILVISNLLWRR